MTVSHNVAVFAESGSLNLGDRAIAVGTSRLARLQGLNARHHSLTTLRGTQPGVTAKAPATSVTALPGPRRGHRQSGRAAFRIVRSLLLLPRATLIVRRSEAVVIGGGALLQTDQLRFPLSIFIVSLACRLAQRPYSVVGVGVEGDLSKSARLLLRAALHHATHVQTRDPHSQTVLAEQLGTSAEICADLATSGWWTPAAFERSRKGVAINVKRVALAEQESQLRRAAHFLSEADSSEPVTLFTTGLPEDLRRARAVAADLAGSEIQLFAPSSLGDLMTFLSHQRVVSPDRLHSAILGLVAGATIDLGCCTDVKVRSFFGRDHADSSSGQSVMPAEFLDSRPQCRLLADTG